MSKYKPYTELPQYKGEIIPTPIMTELWDRIQLMEFLTPKEHILLGHYLTSLEGNGTNTIQYKKDVLFSILEKINNTTKMIPYKKRVSDDIHLRVRVSDDIIKISLNTQKGKLNYILDIIKEVIQDGNDFHIHVEGEYIIYGLEIIWINPEITFESWEKTIFEYFHLCYWSFRQHLFATPSKTNLYIQFESDYDSFKLIYPDLTFSQEKQKDTYFAELVKKHNGSFEESSWAKGFYRVFFKELKNAYDFIKEYDILFAS